MDNIDNVIKTIVEKYKGWKQINPALRDIREATGLALTQQDVYLIMNPDTCLIAPCGKPLQFSCMSEGFKLCGRQCSCVRMVSKKNRNETVINKYGVSNVSELQEVKNKKKERSLDVYGTVSPVASPEVRAKGIKTSLNRYGTEYPSQSNEVRKKVRSTNLSRYGVEYAIQNSDILDRVKKTNMERYGVEFAITSEIVKSKTKKTNMERYGAENVMGSSEIKEKIRQTNLDRYGTEWVATSEFKDKQRKTNLLRYGVEHATQKHMSEQSLMILKNSEEFSTLMKENSTVSAATILNVNPSTIANYCKLYDITFNKSSYEHEISNILDNLKIKYLRNNRHLGLELDFYFPEHKFGIEFNGIYWHSSINKPNDYHRRKYELARNAGIRLLMINEDEWLSHRQTVISRIYNILGISQRGLGARSLIISKKSTRLMNDFFNEYHIQGKTSGLIYTIAAMEPNGEIVAGMGFCKQRGTGDIELIRFCTSGKNHPGIFSRMFNAACQEQNYIKVVSFSDLRYSQGNVYIKNGFLLEREIKPDYRYVIKNRTYHKSSFKKRDIERKFKIDMSNLTERQAMEQLNIPRIYDCGKLKFVWKK